MRWRTAYRSFYYETLNGDDLPDIVLPAAQTALLVIDLQVCYVPEATPPGATPADIAEHLVAEMAAEGEAILAEGIARDPADIDLVEIHGYGFPRRRGGPMFHASHGVARRAEKG